MGESIPIQTLLEAPPNISQLLSPQIPVIPPVKKEFTCFADLTTEIRLAIWKLTFPPYREIDISTERLKIRRVCPDTHLGEPKSCTHPPIALSINHESRYETLLYYKVFVREIKKDGQNVARQMIYYQPKQDVLYVKLESLGEPEYGHFDWLTSKTIDGHSDPWSETIDLAYCDWYESVRRLFLNKEIMLLRNLEGLNRLDCVIPIVHRWELEHFEEQVDRALYDVGEESGRAFRESGKMLFEGVVNSFKVRVMKEECDCWDKEEGR